MVVVTVLKDFLSNLRVAEPQVYQNLTVFPLIGVGPREVGYLLLDEALAKGVLEIREVSQSGSVNEVLVINKGDAAVLLMDGEILTGAKQNRVVNASILVAAAVQLKIPVSCVEAGRWHYVADRFSESARFSYAFLRAKKATQVTENLAECRAFSADQGAIWEEIGRKHREMGTESRTGAVNEVYESYDDKLKKYCAAFSPLEGQLGVAVFINNSFVCLDAFDSAETLDKLHPKMIESYALDALEQQKRKTKENIPEIGTVEQLLKEIASARVKSFPSVGLGEDLRLRERGIVGSCLVFEDRVIHLAVFASEHRATETPNRNLSSPRRRRRNRM